jgi:hypothetical protein
VFSKSYFPEVYFPHTYFPEVGATAAPVVAASGASYLRRIRRFSKSDLVLLRQAMGVVEPPLPKTLSPQQSAAISARLEDILGSQPASVTSLRDEPYGQEVIRAAEERMRRIGARLMRPSVPPAERLTIATFSVPPLAAPVIKVYVEDEDELLFWSFLL